MSNFVLGAVENWAVQEGLGTDMDASSIERALDRLLPRVEKPARYTGGEFNSVVKDWAATRFRAVLDFPDIYELGMSNLGLAILYDILNKQPGVLA